MADVRLAAQGYFEVHQATLFGRWRVRVLVMAASLRRERVFLVRVWLEPSVEQIPQLRGTVLDVKSGHVRHFADLGDIVELVDPTAELPR